VSEKPHKRENSRHYVAAGLARAPAKVVATPNRFVATHLPDAASPTLMLLTPWWQQVVASVRA
jgi:hypothetical protein